MNANRTPTIAIDMMGGDVGLNTTVQACVNAQKKYTHLKLLLVGDESAIRAHVVYAQLDPNRTEIVHAEQVVGMDEAPNSVIRHKRQSSMWKALELVQTDQAQACVSAGNTGALMACAVLVLRPIKGISRPAICTTVPCRGGHTLWLDLGATVDSKPEQLMQFALMGSVVAQALNNQTAPRVGLLNIGEEDIKGNAVVKETAKLLEQSDLNYVGFVEGNDIYLNENIDVVVCDGFVGNVGLKTSEGVAKFIQSGLKEAFTHNLYSKIVGLLAYPILKRFKKMVDPRNYNGATLVGLQGIVIKSHGNADAFSFSNAIDVAHLQMNNGVIQQIKAQLEKI